MNKELCYFLNIIEEIDSSKSTDPDTLLYYYKFGFVVIDKNNNIVKELPCSTIKTIIQSKKLIQISNDSFFYDDYKTVANKSNMELYLDQITNYITRYGLNMKNPYIPIHNNSANENTKNNQIIVIKMLPEKDCIFLFSNFLRNSLTSLRNDRERAYIVALLDEHMYAGIIDEIKSFEVKILAYDTLNIVPEDPTNFLRYIVYKTTGNQLLIKNSQTIEAIKSKSYFNLKIVEYFANYRDLKELSTIFYRYKPLFLAFKNGSERKCAPIINKIRRLAVKNHKPLPKVSVQNFNLCTEVEQDYLIERMSNRDLIKLINYYLSGDITLSHKLYNIRNGKIFIKEKGLDLTDYLSSTGEYSVIINKLFCKLLDNLREIYNGYTVILPDTNKIVYAFPNSEKQMVGPIPYGTKIKMNDKVSIGVNWDYDADWDLHLHDSDDNHYGWNSYYRTDDRGILYSGDMTSAGSEAFAFKNPKDDLNYILSVYSFRNYTQNNYCNFFICDINNKENPYDSSKLYLPVINIENPNVLGYYSNNTFYFYGGILSTSSVPKSEIDYRDYIKAIKNRAENKIIIKKEILSACGINCVENDENLDTDKVIDLRLENLNNQTLLDFVDGNLTK